MTCQEVRHGKDQGRRPHRALICNSLMNQSILCIQYIVKKHVQMFLFYIVTPVACLKFVQYFFLFELKILNLKHCFISYD